ncbi:uncharacterized protein LOC130366974 isoform X2 [Hyla sarda]|uniref:uncharacterized protein LOC130366974 isoform X2 n=1 Tax=Hyla sarda TaxID=327740 RepID=UPI0024C2A45C|nr:uncharacterized protein LOC130366974 isoform X2 [Hyla sarda]
MGVYASKFNESGGRTLLESTDPSQANWITAHAETCKMSITEVQRCWSRFIMLDPDHNGNVKRSHFLSTDEFGKKLCQQIPIGNDEVITFQAYCSAVSWLANSPQESKIRGFFQTLTSSALTEESLKILLSNLYPSEESNVIDDLSHLLLVEIDKRNKAIDEDQFVSWVHTIPHEKVTSSLQFPIIPLEVMSEPEKELSSVPTNINMEDKWRIRDDQLQQVASLMEKRKRDWRLLANNLGFLEKDCVFFEQNHSEIRDKILDMLQVWRNARGKQAQTEVLQKALRKTNNADIANDIFNLNF